MPDKKKKSIMNKNRYTISKYSKEYNVENGEETHIEVSAPTIEEVIVLYDYTS